MLEQIIAGVRFGDPDRKQMSDAPLSFASLQPEIMPRATEPSAAFEHTLLQLAGEVGLLILDQQAGRLTNGGKLAIHLSAITRTLIQAANEAGVTLEAAAVKNLAKIFDRWPRDRMYPELLDVAAEPEERLPRDMYVEIVERQVRGQTYVVQRCNGLNIGDRLTDNATQADDYRFHDVFHFAYVAVLNWSPVVRSLFRLKRKSTPKIDEVEDGARVTLIEEGITTWIFGQAIKLDFFAGMGSGDLPFDLLKDVRQFVAGYEVDQCPLWLWEEAILQGYAVFRVLQDRRCGAVVADMHQRKIWLEPMTDEERRLCGLDFSV